MNIDLRKINSITKYPSILTYHQLGEKGSLKEDLVETSIFEEDDVINVYEKIDGENSRIVLLGDGEEVDYFIGSREELLTARNDRIVNPYGNIAEFFKPVADELVNKLKGFKGLIAIYFESYGGKTKKAKQYTNSKLQNGRVFDVFKLSQEELDNLLSLDLREISLWREKGNQPYLSCSGRAEFTKMLSLQSAPLLTTLKGSDMETNIEGTFEWLSSFKETKVGIDFNGESEGVIARISNRNKITKIRFEDYKRTLKRKNGRAK